MRVVLISLVMSLLSAILINKYISSFFKNILVFNEYGVTCLLIADRNNLLKTKRNLLV